MITTRRERSLKMLRCAAMVLAASAAARPAAATVRASATVSVHDVYRGDGGRVAIFRVTNNSTAGETIGSVMPVAPGPSWAVTACAMGPTGWTRTPGPGSCRFRSAAGTFDNLPVGASASFQVNFDVLAGSTNVAGSWNVYFAADENVTIDSPLASGGEGGLGASIWVWEVLDAVVSTAAVPLGGACPSGLPRQAVAGALRNIVICGRNHGDVALTPQAASSALVGSFIGTAGTFATGLANAAFSGVVARWDGTTVTTTVGNTHIVRTTIGSSFNATSPAAEFPSYNATSPVPPPVITKTLPSSPANANSLKVLGRVTPFTTVQLFTNPTCTAPAVASGSSAVFELDGFPVSAADNTTTTFHANATDAFGTVSVCSSGFNYVEDSTVPGFAGLRTATGLSATAIRLSWLAASDSVSPASAIVYDICRATVPNGCSPFSPHFTTAPGIRSFDVTGLRQDTRYYFVVRARDEAGNRESNRVEVSGRTLGYRSTVNVTAGAAHACALSAEGAVTCWGRNHRGQVGDGSFTRSSPPTIVLLGAVSVSASAGHFTCAVISNGTVRCWGDNQYGQLGDGTTVGKNSPTLVSGITTAVAVTAGGAHACALLADGTVRCWGGNWKGELGDGTTNESHVPVVVASLSGVTTIAAGTQHTCVTTFDGPIKCWGLNEYGELGDGTNDDRPSPVDVVPLRGASGIAIAAGHWHSCALVADGDVYCWGRGAQGQIGDGNTDDRTEATRVSMPGDVVSIAAGGGHDNGWSCAITGSGWARCWGANYRGNFSIGAITNETPMPQTLSYPD